MPGSRQTPATGTYAPALYPDQSRGMFGQSDPSDKQKFLVWRAEEIAAKPENAITAKDSVVAAWKRLKARELAKAKAEAIANSIRTFDKSGEDLLIQKLRDEAEQVRQGFESDPKALARAKAFPINGVCPLTSWRGNPTGDKGLDSLLVRMGDFPAPYHPFTLAPSENLKYPSREILDAIINERTKPPKTVLVLTDTPKDTYYVVTLIKRDEKTDFDYRREVLNVGGTDMFGGQRVLGMFQFEAQQKTMQSVMGLLKKEFKYEETEEQKKRLDENDKRGSNE